MWRFLLRSLLDVSTFTGWVSFFALSCIPAQIVLGVHLMPDLPAALSRRSRLSRGWVMCTITVGLGALAAFFFEATVGGGNGPRFPPLVMFSIVAIVSAFWLAVVLGGWPFILLKNKIAAVALLLIACYAVAYLLFAMLFNFSFLRGSPIYVERLDPGGLFNGWYVMVFLVTAITGMFLVPSFGFWLFPQTQPAVRGLIWTAVCLIWGTALFLVGVKLLDVEVVTFLIRVPIPLLFGGVIVMQVLRDSLFGSVNQPLKGVLNLTTSIVVGSGLMMVFQAVSVMVNGRLPTGPPVYQLELWLANATLAITFPFMIFQAEFFDFWPFSSGSSPTQDQHRRALRPDNAL